MLLNPFFGFAEDAPPPDGVVPSEGTVTGDPFREILHGVQRAQNGEQSSGSIYPSLAQVFADAISADTSQRSGDDSQNLAMPPQIPGLERDASVHTPLGQAATATLSAAPLDTEVPIEPGLTNGLTRVQPREQALSPLQESPLGHVIESDPAVQTTPMQTQIPFGEGSIESDSGPEQPIASSRSPQPNTFDPFAAISSDELPPDEARQIVVDRDDSEIVTTSRGLAGNDRNVLVEKDSQPPSQRSSDRSGEPVSTSSTDESDAPDFTTVRQEPERLAVTPRIDIAPQTGKSESSSSSGPVISPSVGNDGSRVGIQGEASQTPSSDRLPNASSPERTTVTQHHGQVPTQGTLFVDDSSETEMLSDLDVARLSRPMTQAPSNEADVLERQIEQPQYRSEVSPDIPDQPAVRPTETVESNNRIETAMRQADSPRLVQDIVTTLNAQQTRQQDLGEETGPRVADLLRSIDGAVERPVQAGRTVQPQTVESRVTGLQDVVQQPRTFQTPETRGTIEDLDGLVRNVAGRSHPTVGRSESGHRSEPPTQHVASPESTTIAHDRTVRSSANALPEEVTILNRSEQPVIPDRSRSVNVQPGQQDPIPDYDVSIQDLLPQSRPEAPTISSTPSASGSEFVPNVAAVRGGQGGVEAMTFSDQPIAQPTEMEESKVTSQIVRGARFISREGANQVTLRLDPPELGEVTIRLSSINKTVTGEIRVESRMVQEIVNRNMAELRESLGSQGIQVDNIEVSVESGGRSNVDRDGNAAHRREQTERDGQASDRDRQPEDRDDEQQDRIPHLPLADGNVDYVA